LASNILLFGTAAMRTAANGDLLAMMIGRDCGVPCHVIGEDTEARLAFTGATTEFRYADRTLVIDLGGASTECVVGAEGQIENWMSLPMGAGVATSTCLTEDPPSQEDLSKLTNYLHDNLAALPNWSAQHALITGGTALNLGYLLDDPNDRVLDSAKLEVCRQKLHSEPSETVAATYQIDPTRARVLQAGVEIVDELMKKLALETIEIAVYGVNDGAILAYLEDPSGWWETRVLTA
jgi:exopolyphosphatase/guanosine-5'-triphosphate,3'-diphosphate pyrophosphatase